MAPLADELREGVADKVFVSTAIPALGTLPANSPPPVSHFTPAPSSRMQRGSLEPGRPPTLSPPEFLSVKISSAFAAADCAKGNFWGGSVWKV